MAKSEVAKFQKTVLDFYKKNGRHHLPWRVISKSLPAGRQAYRILVSEVMLQQTQVDRVVPYYKNFLKKFPTVQKLSKAPLGDVLRVWSGLGYNRRAKMLHDAAKKIIIYGNFPSDYKTLTSLPGVGDYTAKAVRVFAFNQPELLIETNVRTVFIHHFFSRTKRKITDQEIVSYMELCSNAIKNPREWYAALMDYGTYLKKTHGNISRKSKTYVKQKPLKGSDREIRGVILKALQQSSHTLQALQKLPFEKNRLKEQLAKLVEEQLITKIQSRYSLPE